MANLTYDDIFTMTLESRTSKLADNISKNNALLKKLKEKQETQYYKEFLDSEIKEMDDITSARFNLK